MFIFTKTIKLFKTINLFTLRKSEFRAAIVETGLSSATCTTCAPVSKFTNGSLVNQIKCSFYYYLLLYLSLLFDNMHLTKNACDSPNTKLKSFVGNNLQ